MNISNHSFDENNGTKIKLRTSHIIILSLLVVILIFFIILFVLIKNSVDKEKQASNNESDVPTTESYAYTEENFTSTLDKAFSNMYSYDFNLIINGNNNDFSYMGDFLDDVFLNGNVSNEIQIVGNVRSSSASFKVYKGKKPEEEDSENETHVSSYTTFVKEDGLIIDAGLGAFLINKNYEEFTEYQKDFIQRFNCCSYIKLSDKGIRGEDIIPTFISAINNCNSDMITYGKTSNNNYGVSIKDGALSLPEDNPLSTIVNNYHGDLTMEIITSTDINGLKVVTILGEGTDISFKFEATENQIFNVPPLYYSHDYPVITVEEYKEKYGEFDYDESLNE